MMYLSWMPVTNRHIIAVFEECKEMIRNSSRSYTRNGNIQEISKNDAILCAYTELKQLYCDHEINDDD